MARPRTAEGASPKLSLRVPRIVIDQLNVLAAADNRNRSNYILDVLKKAVKENGKSVVPQINPTLQKLNETTASINARASGKSVPIHPKSRTGK